MAARWRAAVIGCGNIGGRFDEALPDGAVARTHASAYRRLPDVALVAAVDTDTKRATEFAKRWQVPRVFSSAQDMLEQARPQIVSLCTPNDTHLELIERCVDAGVRAIWCEKPLGTDLAAAQKAVARCRRNGVALAVNYMRRWLDQAIEIKSELDRGSLGRPLWAICYYTKGVIHNGSHTVDLLRYWFGEPTHLESCGIATGGDDPSVSASLEFSNGLRAVLIGLGEPGYSVWEVDLCTEKGRVRLRDGGAVADWQTAGPSSYPGFRMLSAPKIVMSDLDHVFAKVAADVVKAAAGDASLASDGESALKTLAVCQQLVQRSRHAQTSSAGR